MGKQARPGGHGGLEHGQGDGRLNTSVKSESVETFRVTVAGAAASVDASVVARPTAETSSIRCSQDGSLGLPIGWRGCVTPGAAPDAGGQAPGAQTDAA